MQRALKWIGLGVGAVVALLIIAVGVLYSVGSSRVERTFAVEPAGIAVPSDAEAVARGAHLARIHGCTDCHNEDLSGKVYVDAPPFRVVASNLTPGHGGVGGHYSADDWDRAIRNGVKPDGRPVIIMPSAAFHRMSDEDAAALIAYLQNVPPVDNELPLTEIRAPGRLIAAFEDFSTEVRTERAREGRSPAAGPTAEYGAYLASMTCAYCHGEDLRGNPEPPIPGSPPAPDLAPSGNWPIAEFKKALRTGITPGGRELDAEFMPWSLTAAMTDEELEALHTHFSTLAVAPLAKR